MIHGGDSRAEARGEAGYAAHADRPVRLSRGDAKRIASEMVDDVLRGGERATVATIAQALQDGVITSAEAPGVAAQCRGLMRDLERLAVRCTAEVKP